MAEVRVAKWYFGGLASAAAACITHPLDLIKVHLQTQQEKKSSIFKVTQHVIRNNGILGLYNGLSASLLRQLTYSTVCKQALSPAGEDISFLKKIGLGGIAGAAGGFVGTPGDMVNVRMQNDVKLPPAERRNYKHALDGLWKVYKTEGLVRCFSGATMATSRAVFITIGQLSCYDQFKMLLLKLDAFEDTISTHFLASFLAGSVATALTQPLDVLKTRSMNAKPGEFKNLLAIIIYTARNGPLGFYKGFVPAFVRLAPHTILTFLFLEQLRVNFGTVVQHK